MVNLKTLIETPLSLIGAKPARKGRTGPIDIDPRPLIDKEARFVLLWSPKVACTTTTIWFFTKAGLAEKARAYDVWPHRYRLKVHYGSAYHRKAAAADLGAHAVLKIIRDPYSRVVSSYRHSLRTGYAVKAMEKALGRPVDIETGYSFREFLDFLEREDLRRCNTHHRLQHHPIEDTLAPTEIINISRQNLFAGLNAFEHRIGLPQTDFETLSWLRDVEKKRKSRQVSEGAPAYETRFSRKAARPDSTRWPSNDLLLVPEARDRVRRLYARDFEAYGAVL